MKRGFTLIELLLVIVLMACMLATAVVSYSGLFSGMELKQSANDMVSLMRYAKNKAMAERAVVRIIFQDDFKRYRLQQANVSDNGQQGDFENIAHRLGKEVVLPRSVKAVAETSQISFYPDGTIDRVRVQLESKNKKLIVSSREQRGYVFILEE